ncbi:hypothetical protein IMAU60211_00869 [Lactobacillus helveticus]|nr:hypothetical protein [Lactobacillus helveticus]NRO16398.1 hypothetical protein [Lactobacillus helveticus]NRO20540.1 hypothetical protein [Lactobacillus helveticus]NRO32770.1 hypothetical protein [Lactobacillus helveticus]NRO40846.1 hypothetical protein [Lactobacillus helveticus]
MKLTIKKLPYQLSDIKDLNLNANCNNKLNTFS